MIFVLLLSWLCAANDTLLFTTWADDQRPAAEVPVRIASNMNRPSIVPLEAAPSDPSVLERVQPGYRFAGTLFSEVAHWVHDRPGWVRPERIGTTVHGRPIWAFHLARPGRPIHRKVLVFGGIHALEWISTEVATDVLLDLGEHGPPPGVQVTVIPLLNPDGRAAVEADIRVGKSVYRRGNGRNVDLNRDFAINREKRAFWRKIIPGYYATSKSALSQPETQAIDALADRERYHRVASLHSFGGFFYAPWAGRFHRTQRQDRREHWELGRAMELAWGTRAYRTRQLGRWGFFFRAHGAEVDHFYGRYGARSFLIEVSRSGIHPLNPKTYKVGFHSYNPDIPRRMHKHIDRTAQSVKALIRHPELESEREARLNNNGMPRPPIEGDEAP